MGKYDSRSCGSSLLIISGNMSIGIEWLMFDFSEDYGFPRKVHQSKIGVRIVL